MPELPEVETVLYGLKPVMEGQQFKEVITNRPNLRYPFPDDFAERLIGKLVNSIKRRAKYLVLELDSGDSMIVHLGMSGRVQVHQNEYCPKPHDHVVFQMSNGITISYNDARRFGFIDLCQQSKISQYKSFMNLGPEPLGEKINADYLLGKAKGCKSPLKNFLLDQTVIAGLGNIYVCEALFLAKLDPRAAAYTLTDESCKVLILTIQAVLKKAIAAGGSTLRDHQQTNGEMGYFQHQFHVYGREGEPCLTCNSPVQRIVQSGRSTFFCPNCQS